MSLLIDVSVNRDAISTISIQRITNTGVVKLTDDTVSTYEVSLMEKYPHGGIKYVSQVGTIEHRFGDGVYACIAKALALIESERNG